MKSFRENIFRDNNLKKRVSEEVFKEFKTLQLGKIELSKEKLATGLEVLRVLYDNLVRNIGIFQLIQIYYLNYNKTMAEINFPCLNNLKIKDYFNME